MPDAEVEPTEAAAVKAPAAEPAEVPSTNVIDTEPVKKEEVIDIPDELLDVEIMDIEIEDKEPTLF